VQRPVFSERRRRDRRRTVPPVATPFRVRSLQHSSERRRRGQFAGQAPRTDQTSRGEIGRVDLTGQDERRRCRTTTTTTRRRRRTQPHRRRVNSRSCSFLSCFRDIFGRVLEWRREGILVRSRSSFSIAVLVFGRLIPRPLGGGRGEWQPLWQSERPRPRRRRRRERSRCFRVARRSGRRRVNSSSSFSTSREIFDVPVLRGRLGGSGLGELPHKSRERARSRVILLVSILVGEQLGFVRNSAMRQVTKGEDRTVARRRELLLLLLVRVDCARVKWVPHDSPDRDRRGSEGAIEASASASLSFEVSNVRILASFGLADLPVERASRARSAW
jgi:hypothetical protein